MITPYEKYDELGKAIGLSANNNLFLKREDLHPLGSHKGRSISMMIDKYIEDGFHHFAISSSGNAALAAGLYIKKLNKKRKDKIILEILLGRNIEKDKLEILEKLKDENILLSIHDRPLQALYMKIQDNNVRSLRQSIDDTALLGYKSLAEELIEIPDLKGIFIATSSGTTAEALAQYFIDNKKDIEIHIVQTTSCHPITDTFERYDGEETPSIAKAIVDHTARRKGNIRKLIEKIGGKGWIAKNEIIETAQKLVKDNTGIVLSPNGALSIAGLLESIYAGYKHGGSIVCIVGGL